MKMRWPLFFLFTFPLWSFAQTTTQAQSSEQGSGKAANVKPTLAQPSAAQAQEENKNAVKNDFPIGPFDRNGNYNFLFDKKETGQ